MKTKRRLSRAQAQRVHAKERFRIRKNIELTEQLHCEAVERIRTQDPSVRFIKKESHCRSVWIIAIAGVECRVVYDRYYRNIVTVLPERWNADYVQRWWEN